MKDDRLQVAFLWHMHQPYYRALETMKCTMPWVRLHAAKDYVFMPALLQEYHHVKANFNLVPSLLKQIQHYTAGFGDATLDLTGVPAGKLSTAQKIAILKSFFLANPENMIQPYPAYRDLLARRGDSLKEEELESRLTLFSEQDFCDLQTWFNLTWIHPLEMRRSPKVQALLERGRNFTEEDKQGVLEVHAKILSQVVPVYRGLQEAGQIEISTSPFYHPILPLLCDTEIAREAMPHIQLPDRFLHPEDAQAQIQGAVQYYLDLFGRLPQGMWPSEGSVSEQAIQLIADAGIQWIATDEEILSHSLPAGMLPAGKSLPPGILYKPYRRRLSDDKSLHLIFRDHALSDLIGFVYHRWNAKDAANDLIHRLKAIRSSLNPKDGPHLVPIVLDGENAWEYYPRNGEDFLRSLYEQLAETPEIVTVRIQDHLEQIPDSPYLSRVFPGSWINHNFKIWIGHSEDNASWNYLKRVRQDLVEWEVDHREERFAAARALAWEALYIAEGSDWNWWYGDDHFSTLSMEFDQLYREQLATVYHAMEKSPPEFLSLPIRQMPPAIGSEMAPRGLISPLLDGEVSDYFEWLEAGYMDARKAGEHTTMHQTSSAFEAVYYGCDHSRFFLRVDFKPDFLQNRENLNYELAVRFLEPQPRLVRIRSLRPSTAIDLYVKDEHDYWSWREQRGIRMALGKILELAVPFEEIQAGPDDELRFWVVLKLGEKDVERFPPQGPVALCVPDHAALSGLWNA